MVYKQAAVSLWRLSLFMPYEIPPESLVIQKSPGRILSCINLEYIFSIYRFANLLNVGNYDN